MQQPRLYNWQVWPAKNHPVCRGRCLFGPDLGVWLCNISIITVCSVLFFVYVAINIHPAIIVFGILLDFLALGSLMFATFTEPGIIPRQYHPLGTPRPPPQTQLVNGVQIPLKYCDTCHIYRPPRTKHCRDCDNCIEEFDHHCPWVCNCVGRRNYRYFVIFVWSVCLLDLYVFINCGYFLIHEGISTTFSDAVSLHPIPTALTAVTLMLGCCLGSLAGYHCGLIAEQITTNEHIKRSRLNPSEESLDGDLHQHSISYCDAMKRTFCIPVPQSRIHLREFALPIPTGVSTAPLNDPSIHTTLPPESHATTAPIAQPIDDEIRETSRDRMMHDELHHVV